MRVCNSTSSIDLIPEMTRSNSEFGFTDDLSVRDLAMKFLFCRLLAGRHSLHQTASSVSPAYFKLDRDTNSWKRDLPSSLMRLFGVISTA